MLNFALLSVFIPTFLFVSITPGMCMILSMTLGISIGVKKTQWMMLGELFGVGLIAVLSVMIVGAILLSYPQAFNVLKFGGGVYLAYLGIGLWRSKGKMAIQDDQTQTSSVSAFSLISLGFITAIANPKGWAFFIALLPPFLDESKPLLAQLIILVGLILLIELACLYLYAISGKVMRTFLQKSNNVKTLNRISGTLMMGVAVWLVLG